MAIGGGKETLNKIFKAPAFTLKEPESLYFWGALIFAILFFVLGFLYHDLSMGLHIRRTIRLLISIVFFFIIAFILGLLDDLGGGFTILAWILAILFVLGHSGHVYY